MRTAFRSLMLSAALAALVATGGLSTAPALQKDKDKKADAVGTIEVYQDKKDGWRYRVKNAEGKSMVGSYVAHEKKEDCLKELELLKTTLSKAKVVEIKEKK